MNERLLSEIDRFLREEAMGEYRFGFLAAKNGRLIERLRAGRRIWPDTEAQVRAFMISKRHQRTQAAKADQRPAA